MVQKKEMKTVRLRKLEGKLALLEKSRNYVEGELKKIREKENYIRDKIRKEKKAILLVNKAKRLR